MKIKDNVLIITSIAEDVSGIEAIKSEFEKNHKDYNVVVIDERQYGAEKAATRRRKNRERLIQSIPTFYRRVKTVGHVFTMKSKNKIDRRRALSNKLSGSARKIYNAVLRFAPDVIVVTTPRLMHETIIAKKRTRFKYPVIGLSEKFTFDKAFYNMSADGYIVENVDMKNQLTAMGYSSGRVHVMGFPIEENVPDVDYVFKLKEHLGLNLNPTVYLSGGAIGSKELMPVFELLLDQGDIINLIVNCGKNENLYSAMLRETERRNSQNVKLYLNVDEGAEDTLLASDCLITIYDGSLIYRAFLLGIPVVAFAPDTGAEKSDLKYLMEKQLVYFADDYNHVIIGMYDVIQTGLGKKLSESALMRTRATSLKDICTLLASYGRK